MTDSPNYTQGNLLAEIRASQRYLKETQEFLAKASPSVEALTAIRHLMMMVVINLDEILHVHLKGE